MGINYYWQTGPENRCAACNHLLDDSPEQVHIGKSSAGWAFLLRIHPELRVHNLEDWKALWSKPGSVIYDGSGQTITPDLMLSIITDRSNPLSVEERDFSKYFPYESVADFHFVNHSYTGPHKLLFPKENCGTGDTYVLVDREFC